MRATLITFTAAALLALGGCKSKSTQMTGMTGQELNNRQRLQSAPFAVTESFLRDFPNATITSADSYSDSSGRTLYRVSYIRESRRDSVLYTPTGERLSPPVAWLE